MDDVPVGLYKTQEAAEKAARNISIKACENIANRCDLYTTSHVCFFVCGFKAGQMTSAYQVTREDDA